MRILVACFGNVLRSDDGFGPAVAGCLEAADLPAEVTILDVGIGGIHMVHELLEPVELLIVVDAIKIGRPPGSLVVIRPDIVDVDEMSTGERRDALADMHYATPERALMLAGALGALPAQTWMLGCEAVDAETVAIGLSAAVSAAVGPAAAEILRMVHDEITKRKDADPSRRA